MPKRIPKRLNNEPLLEAVWELRFAHDGAVPVAEMLPGLLYQQAQLLRQPARVLRLPHADIPRPIVQADENLRFLPLLRLEGAEDDPFSIQVGERMVSLNCRRPYAGWPALRARILALVERLRETGLIRQPERFSLKYIDLLELDPPPSLASIEAALKLAGRDLGAQPLQLRTELAQPPFVHILQIATPVEVSLTGQERRQGTLVDIDTICQPEGVRDAGDFWQRLPHWLEEAHTQSKQLFFDLLTDAAIARLQPVYE